jgi:ssDNA-binding Zn-finger/Zn-ribbon topoisomerase 1
MALSNLMMGWPLVIGLVATFAWVAVKYARAETIAVQRKACFLSVAERNLFDCLVDALSDEYVVFAKVGLAEFIDVSPAAKWVDLQQARRELDIYTVDFILCKKADMSVFAVVELEHEEPVNDVKLLAKRKRRDKEIGRICKSADLKFLYFDVRTDYKELDVCRLITGKSKCDKASEHNLPGTHQSQLTIDDSSHSISTYARSCPKCRSEVVTKVSVKGSNIGEKFLMCRKYPYCDYRIAKKDLKRVTKASQNEERKPKP